MNYTMDVGVDQVDYDVTSLKQSMMKTRNTPKHKPELAVLMISGSDARHVR